MPLWAPGGHALEILKRITPGGKLIGIDRDEDSLAICRKRLSEFSSSCEFVHGNFVDLDQILEKISKLFIKPDTKFFK